MAEREYYYDGDIGNFCLFDILSWNEFNSLMKSNRFTRAYRYTITHCYIPSRVIREHISLMVIVEVVSGIINIIKNKKRS